MSSWIRGLLSRGIRVNDACEVVGTGLCKNSFDFTVGGRFSNTVDCLDVRKTTREVGRS